MGKNKIKRIPINAATASGRAEEAANQNGYGPTTGDMGDIASALMAEYDSLDSSLILAILSDFPPNSLRNHLHEIRDQLAILQASTVPDTAGDDDDDASAVHDQSTSVSDLADALESTLVSSSARSDTWAKTDGREHMASGSGSSRSGTSDRQSPGGGQESPDDELELLRSLFPALVLAELQTALHDAVSLQAAIDQLLSVELIKDVQRTGYWPGEDQRDYTSGLSSDEEGLRHVATAINEARCSDSLAPQAMSRGGSASSASSIKQSVPAIRPASTKPTPRQLHQERQASRTRTKKTKTPLFDTFDRMPTPSSASSRGSSRGVSPAPRSGGLSGSNPNAWHTIASLASHLAELVPSHPQQYFLSHLHSPRHRSAYAAVRASLAALPATPSESSEVTETILQDLYGESLVNGQDQRRQGDLRAAMRVAGDDVSVILDLVDLLEEISHWPSDEDAFDLVDSGTDEEVPEAVVARRMTANQRPASDAEATHPVFPERLTKKPRPAEKDPAPRIIPGAQPAPTSAAFPTAHDDFGTPPSSPKPERRRPRVKPAKQVHPLNWRKVEHPRPSRAGNHPHASHIPSYALGKTSHSSAPNSLYAPANGYSIDDCLRNAALERHRREVAIRAAGKHFSTGGHLPGGKGVNASVASHYAAQARQAADQARDWELRAARMVVNTQLQSNGHTVDLHHMTTHEATTVALEVATKWYDQQKAAIANGAMLDGIARQRDGALVPGKALVVVTGIGRHSAGKVGVLGPAVAAALEREGWRVERYPEKGYLTVKGRR